MTTCGLAGEVHRLVLAAGQGGSAMARDLLVLRFGMTSEGAERLLAEGGMIEIRAEAGKEAGQACLTLLRVLGVEAHLAGPDAGEHALGLRLLAPEGLVWLRDHWPTADHIVLQGPRGLVISGLSAAQAGDLAARLGGNRGLWVVPLAVGGVVDLFGPEPHWRAGLELRAYLGALGLRVRDNDIFGRIAVGLEAEAARRVVARFGAQGYFVLPPEMQLYEIEVTGAGRLSPAELRDFRALRRGETGLVAETARSFLKDYQRIGVQARIVPMGLQARALGQ
jgi:hypothetical protein